MIDPADAALRKHSVVIAGHRTSISLESAFWDGLRAIAAADGRSVASLVTEIDRRRTGTLSGAIRVYVLQRAARGALAGG
ncbi:ribbon-helix-helix domain-containing protein [Stella sp.]|uniref:ribbon-helix-helix domain-containing protein n=1 Tax=Stella sp. TaxID=2912054 RepID=UPI0035B2FC14